MFRVDSHIWLGLSAEFLIYTTNQFKTAVCGVSVRRVVSLHSALAVRNHTAGGLVHMPSMRTKHIPRRTKYIEWRATVGYLGYRLYNYCCGVMSHPSNRAIDTVFNLHNRRRCIRRALTTGHGMWCAACAYCGVWGGGLSYDSGFRGSATVKSFPPMCSVCDWTIATDPVLLAFNPNHRQRSIFNFYFDNLFININTVNSFFISNNSKCVYPVYIYYFYNYLKFYFTAVTKTAGTAAPMVTLYNQANLCGLASRPHTMLTLTFKRHAYAISLVNYYAGSIFTYSAGMFIPSRVKLFRTKERKKQIISYLRSLKKKKRKQERKKLGISRWKCLRRKLFIKLAMTRYVSFLLLRCMPRLLIDLYVRGLPSNFLIFWGALTTSTTSGSMGRGSYNKGILKHKIGYVYFRNRFITSKTRRRLKRRLQRRLLL